MVSYLWNEKMHATRGRLCAEEHLGIRESLIQEVTVERSQVLMSKLGRRGKEGSIPRRGNGSSAKAEGVFGNGEIPSYGCSVHQGQLELEVRSSGQGF